jgi:RNA polymerase sigma factor (sigma-70 family)
MSMTPDSELLRHFARTNSEDTFAELVKRHVNLVYSAALRQVGGDAHLAKDVAQTVFTDLARKASALSRRHHLSGWLYTSTHFAAAKMTRSETRRRDREEQFMREPNTESAPAAEWEHLRPLLDDVMHELKEADRNAILLRYFENRPFAEVGAKLGLNENAARMRVERALEKLRAIFAKRGVVTTSALVAAISANAVELAPANLAATLTVSAVTSAGAGTFTLMKILTATKLKLGLATLVVAGGTTVIALQQQGQGKLRRENAALQQKISQLQSGSQNSSNQITSANNSGKLSNDQFDELLRLRGKVGVLQWQNAEIDELQRKNQELLSAIKQYQNNSSSTSVWLSAELKLLQERYSQETKLMGITRTNLDSLRERYGVTDTLNISNGEIREENTQPSLSYWVEKGKFIQLLNNHRLTYSKLQTVKLEQQIKSQASEN